MIGILIIATGKYKEFAINLIEDIFIKFNSSFGIHLYTDEIIKFNPTTLLNEYDLYITQKKISPYKFPQATLYRYKIFNDDREKLQKYSHLLYLDADMKIIENCGIGFLVDGLLAVRHPGFYVNNCWGSENNPIRSTSWFPAKFRKHYYAGGVQGGKAEHYLKACKILSERIERDKKNNTMAIWHDETHWNKYCNFDHPELVTSLDPSYCMVEEMELREKWGIANLNPKIIALKKNHAELRK